MAIIITGSLIIVIGLIFKFFPPKKINWLYGWRSRFSMRNQDIWDEAQKYGANLVTIGGLILLLIGLVAEFLLHNRSEIITIVAVALIFIAIFVIGEMHLKRLFHKDGTRKS